MYMTHRGVHTVVFMSAEYLEACNYIRDSKSDFFFFFFRISALLGDFAGGLLS